MQWVKYLIILWLKLRNVSGHKHWPAVSLVQGGTPLLIKRFYQFIFRLYITLQHLYNAPPSQEKLLFCEHPLTLRKDISQTKTEDRLAVLMPHTLPRNPHKRRRGLSCTQSVTVQVKQDPEQDCLLEHHEDMWHLQVKLQQKLIPSNLYQLSTIFRSQVHINDSPRDLALCCKGPTHHRNMKLQI